MVLLSSLLQKDLQVYQSELAAQVQKSQDADFKAKMQSLMTAVGASIVKLAKLGFMNSVAECICNSHQEPDCLKLFDTKKGFIPVRGCSVIDLQNERAIERNKEHYFTYELNIRYNQNKVDPRLNAFFATLMLEDQLPPDARVKTVFLQTLLGYALTGENVEKYLIILWGAGNNGKSTLIKLLLELFSKHVCATMSVCLSYSCLRTFAQVGREFPHREHVHRRYVLQRVLLYKGMVSPIC